MSEALLGRASERMGLDRTRSDTLWKDRALVELNQAVIHSFQLAGVKLVDHHVAAQQFVLHEQREERAGRPTPTDWAWVVPPISGSTAPTFHRSYSTRPELSPNFRYQQAPWDVPGFSSRYRPGSAGGAESRRAG